MAAIVRKPVPSRNHLQAMRQASDIGETLLRMYRPGSAMAKPEDIIGPFKKDKIGFILMGAYGINGYRDEPRATADVDLLIRPKDHEKAAQIIRELYPELKELDGPAVTRFVDPANDKSVIDLMRPNDEVLKLAFKCSVPVGKSHRVPDLEMALASKFAAMVSPNRKQSKRLMDGGDFVSIVETNANDIDKRKLRRLGEKVYKGGGEEILKLVDDAAAGRRIVF